MSKENGGPAFPVTEAENQYRRTSEGMTLRDYFAAKAMQGLLNGYEARLNQERIDNLTERAFTLADAMLEARKQ